MARLPKACLFVLFLFFSFSNGEELHFDSTWAAECNVYNGTTCNFMDAKYWVPKKSPENGDSIRLDISNIQFGIQTPINISMIRANLEGVTIFIASAAFGIADLNGQGSAFLQHATLQIGHEAIYGQTYEFNGDAFFELDVDSLILGIGNFQARNLTTRQFFSLIEGSTLTSDSIASYGSAIMSGAIQATQITFNGSPLRGTSLNAYKANITANNMVLSQGLEQIEFASANVTVHQLVVQCPLLALTDATVLKSILPINFTQQYTEIRLRDSTITTPSFDLYNGVIDGHGLINGNVTTYSNTFIRLSTARHLYITGDVSFNSGRIQWSFVTNNSDYDGLSYGKILINGTIHNAAFGVYMQVQGFLPKPTDYLPLVHFTKNGLNMTDIYSLPSSSLLPLVFGINGNSIAFMWVPINAPIAPPVSPPPDPLCRFLDQPGVTITLCVMAALIMVLFITVGVLSSKLRMINRAPYDVIM